MRDDPVPATPDLETASVSALVVERQQYRGKNNRVYTVSPTADRFWPRVQKAEGDGCWLWIGPRKTKAGYGAFGIRRESDGKWKSHFAHRVSYELHFGPIPPGMFVCHRCDNPQCVRPDHLFLGEHADNMRDMRVKKRQYTNEKAWARSTTCRRGHEYTPDNTYYHESHGQLRRHCKRCNIDRQNATRNKMDSAPPLTPDLLEAWRVFHDDPGATTTVGAPSVEDKTWKGSCDRATLRSIDRVMRWMQLRGTSEARERP